MKVTRGFKMAVCVVAMVLFALLPVAHAGSRPIEALIIDQRGRTEPPENLAYLTGNVRVTLSNGGHENWTRSWHCELAKVAKSGLVGWTHARQRNYQGEWMNKELWIARSRRDRIHVVADLPFIEGWGFAEKDTCVVVHSRGPHGPSRIQKFQIATGELLDECSGEAETVPEWAKPFAN